MIFRELKTYDVSECLNLFTEVYASQTLVDYPELRDEFRKNSLNGKLEIINAIDCGEMYGFVVEEGVQLIGFILLTSPNYIRKLAVRQDFQHRGIASQLVELCNKENDVLVVHAAEKAIPFYEKIGFVKDGEMNREKYPYLPMRKGEKKQ